MCSSDLGSKKHFNKKSTVFLSVLSPSRRTVSFYFNVHKVRLGSANTYLTKNLPLSFLSIFIFAEQDFITIFFHAPTYIFCETVQKSISTKNLPSLSPSFSLPAEQTFLSSFIKLNPFVHVCIFSLLNHILFIII